MTGTRRNYVLVVGCGGLGSWTSYVLAKKGVKEFVLVDPDVVEEKNVRTQLYTNEDVGKPKVEVLAKKLASVGARATPLRARIEEVMDKLEEPALALALTDNIESRLVVEEKFKTLHAMVRPSHGLILMTTEDVKLRNIMRSGRHVGDQDVAMVVTVASVTAREAYDYLTRGTSYVEGRLLIISPYRFEVIELGGRER